MTESFKLLCFLDTLTNLPIIITNMYYAYGSNNQCLIQQTSIQLNIFQWLNVYSYMQLLFVFFAIVSLIYRHAIDETVNCLMVLMILLLLFNSFFQVCWLVIGSIMYWRQLDNKNCGSLGIYMYIILTVGYLLIALNLIISIKTHLNYIKENKLQIQENRKLNHHKDMQEEAQKQNSSNSQLVKSVQ